MKKVPVIFFLLQLIVLSGVVKASNHKYYVSHLLLVYSQNTQSVQITLKIFTDDFEEALSRNSQFKLRLNSSKEPRKTDSIIKAYINKHLVFRSGNKELRYDYIGKEYQEDTTVCYAEIPLAQEALPITLAIENSILLNFSTEQKNLVNFKNGSNRKTFLLNRKKRKAEFRIISPSQTNT